MARFDKLLVLDLDETLIHARETPLEHPPSWEAAGYFVYERPGLREFLRAVFAMFEVGVWTSSSEGYASEVVPRVFVEEPPSFVFARKRCTRAIDLELREVTMLKPILKLRRRGYAREKILYVDDSPEKLVRSYGNLVRVQRFEGDPSDDELPALARYLEELGPVPNVRAIEKRGWRSRPGDAVQ